MDKMPSNTGVSFPFLKAEMASQCLSEQNSFLILFFKMSKFPKKQEKKCEYLYS